MVAQQVKTMNEALAAGELRRAAEAARHAQKLQPDNNEINAVIKELEDKIQKPIAATLDEAVALYEKGDYLESLRAFTKLKEMDPENKDASFYIPQAIGALEKQASAQTAQTTKRRPVYQVERNVKKGMTLYSQGLLVYSQGKIKEAGELWSQALALDPYNDLARNAYSRVQREVSLR
jgi:tetratricopeptide (TPR) repeat protein